MHLDFERGLHYGVLVGRFDTAGKATLATEESSTTMKVASITETAIHQGFTEGFQSRGPAFAPSSTLSDGLHGRFCSPVESFLLTIKSF